MSGDRKRIATVIISDAAALFVAVLPLYIFFLKKQILNQQGGEITLKSLSLSSGFFRNMLYNFQVVFEWNFMSYYSNTTVKTILFIVLLMLILVLILSRNMTVKLFIAVNILTWLLYYFLTWLGVYSYGNFGSRYNLFFIPVWIVLVFSAAMEFYRILSRYIPQMFVIKALYTGICVCCTLCFAYYAWTSKLQKNWSKEDCRGVVNAWYDADAANLNTIIYYAADSGFAYYVRQNSCYNDTTERNVHYMCWYSKENEDEYIEYVNSVYEGDWPNEIYIVASHLRDDWTVFLTSIISMGYEREDVYSSGGAYLIRLTRVENHVEIGID